MERTNTRSALLRGSCWFFVCVIFGLAAASDASAQVQVMRKTGGGDSSAMMPLVNADDDVANALRHAKKYLDDGQYDIAIEILQKMILRPDGGGLISAGDGHRYFAVRVKAHELLGKLPEAGLRRYRALYDAQAERLLEEALAEGDLVKLRSVSEKYLHTSHGLRALELLAAFYFDRAEFPQAARTWQKVRSLKPGRPDPVLDAKIAAALHLGGETREADRAMEELRKKHASAEALLAGQMQPVVKFVSEIHSRPPAVALSRVDNVSGWPGYGAVSGGVAQMDDCEPVVVPKWSTRSPEDGDKGYLAGDAFMGQFHSSYRPVRDLYKGQVRVRFQYAGRQNMETTMPAMIHPLVAGETVLYRTDERVDAVDLYTGQIRWRSVKFPMQRDSREGSARYSPRYGIGMQVGDTGRYEMTIGGGKVFALGNFPPASPPRYVHGRQPKKDPLGQSSMLMALELDMDGRQLWKVGCGVARNQQGVPEVKVDLLRSCQYVSPPAYDAGRIYVMAVQSQKFFLICLDAETGRYIWDAEVSSTPIINVRGSYRVQVRYAGSAPTVVDGRVYVLTNAGVAAAFEADSGQPLWARQYDTMLDNARRPRYVNGRYQLDMNQYAASPVIAAKGRVIIAPADAEKVFALSTEDGETLWQSDRKNQSHLTAVDENRVLLTGPNAIVLGADNGRQIGGGGYSNRIKTASDRPAVTRNFALISGKGKLYRLNLSDYSVRVDELMAEGGHGAMGLLGNLVAVEGKLLSANSAGISAYFRYEEARGRLTQRLEDASGAGKGDVLHQRGLLAFNAKRFDEALADFQRCQELAELHPQASWAKLLSGDLYRTHVSLGNTAKNDKEMIEQFQKALELAPKGAPVAHMLIRLAKYHRKTGNYEQAVVFAQEVSEKYGETDLVDVQIGKDANMAVRYGPEERRLPGRVIARDFLLHLIELKGQDVYAKFDEKAGKALEEARQKKDPDQMLAVARRWELSKWADDAKFAAAELLYLRAAQEKDIEQAQAFRSRAETYLSQVRMMPNSDLVVSATVALAATYKMGGREYAVKMVCDDVRNLPADTQVSFANISGPLGEVLKSIETGKVDLPTVKMKAIARLVPPLTERYELSDKNVMLLRDENLQPVRLLQNVFAMRGNRVAMLSTVARNVEEGRRWEGLTSASSKGSTRYYHSPPGYRLVGGFSKDGSVLVVADRDTATGLDIRREGMKKWETSYKSCGISSFQCMGISEGRLVVLDRTGKMACIRLDDGKLLWRGTFPKGGRGRSSYPSAPPWIGGTVVVVQYNNFRSAACYDLETGKMLKDWQGKRRVQAMVSPRGLVLTVEDGNLAAWDPSGDMKRPLWERNYRDHYACILGVGEGKIAVSPGNNNNQVDVLDVVGKGQKIASLRVPNVGRSRGLPADAVFDGDQLYLGSSNHANSARKQYYGRFSQYRSIGLAKFDLSGGRSKMDWSTTLQSDSSTYSIGFPIQVTQTHVLFSAKEYGRTFESDCWMVDRKTGKVTEKFSLDGDDKGVVDVRLRRMLIGPPAVTNGAMAVDTLKGLKILAGQ